MVSEAVSEKIGTRKKSRKRYRKKVSEPVSEKIGTGKKSRNLYRKNLVPEKVSELVSKIFDKNFLLIRCKCIVFIMEIFNFVAKI